MNFIRKSRWTRVTVWVLTLALIAPMLLIGQRAARAQTAQPLRVIVEDFKSNTRSANDNLGRNATDAVYNELVASGQGRFDAIPEREVLAEAKAQGLRVPSVAGQPTNFSRFDYLRLAKALNADAIVTGQVAAIAPKGRVTGVVLDVLVHDVAADADINGGQTKINLRPRPGMTEDNEELISNGLRDAALDVVRQLVQRQLVTGTVLNIVNGTVIVNRGARDGLHAGDELVILRDSPSGKIRHGSATIARAYATDSEADIKENVGGIAPEDLVRVLYHPALVYDPGTGNAGLRAPSSHVNFSAIGKTLTVLGIGVLVAVAIKGGQASVTNVHAEPGISGVQPIVRITWGDNIFGQAGVLQYHVFREPDFPFTSSGIGGNNNGNGGGNTGGNGGTTNVANFILPINVSGPTVREVEDRGAPYSPYTIATTIITGSGNGGTTGVSGNNNNGGGGNGNNNQGGCTIITAGAVGALLNTGFAAGTTYRYDVSAVIQRRSVSLSATSVGSTGGTGGAGGGTGGGTGGNTGGGNGGTGNNNGNNGDECIETDPVRSGFATPLTPVQVLSPTASNGNPGTVNLNAFNVNFASETGADLFQVEISADSRFSNPSAIYRMQLFSTSPNQSGVTQTLATPINLATVPELLQNPQFAAFVKNPSSTTNIPTLYVRIGARHDEDAPGPINVISNNPGDGDRTFRFVYTGAIPFTFTPTPPGQPSADTLRAQSRTAMLLNGSVAKSRLANSLPLPLPGDRAQSGKRHVLSLQELLTGRGRPRN